MSPATSDLAKLGHATREWLPNIDEFNRCITNVILPTGNIKVDDGDLSANTENYKEFWHAMVGLAGEGQGFDGNGNYLRLQAVARRDADPHRQDQLLGRSPSSASRRCRRCARARPTATSCRSMTRSVPCSQSPVPNVNDEASTGPADGSKPYGAAPNDDAVAGRRRRLMRVRGLRKQLGNAVWLVAMIATGLIVGSYLLAHERIAWPCWVPGLGKDYFYVNAKFTTAAGVLPGQGNAVTIAGVKVGEISGEKVAGRPGRAQAPPRRQVRARPPGRDAAAAPEDRAEGHGRRDGSRHARARS